MLRANGAGGISDDLLAQFEDIEEPLRIPGALVLSEAFIEYHPARRDEVQHQLAGFIREQHHDVVGIEAVHHNKEHGW